MKLFKPEYLKALPYVSGQVIEDRVRTCYGATHARIMKVEIWNLRRMAAIARWVSDAAF